jgi:hypothetical protein
MDRLEGSMHILKCGNCERLKTSVHAATLALTALCGLYNAAAWLKRRETHLAVNAVLYAALTAWEREHVAHHLAVLRQAPCPAPAPERVEVNVTAVPKVAA